jgi:hypothetical protein
MLNLIQHLIESKAFETLKRPMKQVQDLIQGDRSGFFTNRYELLLSKIYA